MAPSFKLTYFNARARAEAARWILAAANQKYEDKRIEFGNWPPLKPSTPFGGLPILTVDEDGETWTIGQSGAIYYYLAKEFNLLGKTKKDQARAHMIMLGVTEMFEAFIKVKFAKDDVKEETKKKWDEEQKPKLLDSFEKLIQSEPYFVGGALTAADIAVAQVLRDLPDIDVSSYPKLAANKAKVEANPGIAEWLLNRPETHF